MSSSRIFTILVALCALAMPALAMESTIEPTVTGTVTSVDAEQLVLETSTGEQTFMLEPGTQWPRFDLGETIAVTYRTDENENFIVSNIVVSDQTAQAAPHPEKNYQNYDAAAPRPVAPREASAQTEPAVTATASVTTTRTADASTSNQYRADTAAETGAISEYANDYDSDENAIDETLPATATPLPLIALLGLFAVGLATAGRFLR